MRRSPPGSTPPRWQVLVVGRDSALVRGLERGLAGRGYALRAARDGASALVALQQDRPDGIVVDLVNGAAPDGVRLLRRMREIDATVPVLALAPPLAVRDTLTAGAIRAGAFVLGAAAAEVVHAAFQKALGEQRQADTLAYYRRREAKRAGVGQLVGESIPMLRLKTQLRLLLDAEARSREAPSVLLLGASGTGKGEVARALHFDGARRDQPFVRVDVEDLTAPGAETRLFGRERGADAPARRQGLVEAADGGTLFISDLGAMPPALQARLLRLLQQGVMQRVHGTREVPVDVRIVAATRSQPEVLLQAGRLRPDLHRRLAGVPLQLAPLRERGDDLWLLAHCFVKGVAERRGLAPPRLSSAVRETMAVHPWPGNVRELRHALERAVLVQPGGTIDSAHLEFAPPPRPAPPPPPPELNLHHLEREALAQALRRAYGNVSQAARLLGISRDTMRYRIARHALAGTRAAR
ncbi:MAG: sigma 54-interacting transcriptional regulator [Burkholderiaceae bacterium]|nr:sigma 54-interacting transcriptional regulator [Burkholderiaceae bacterium]